MDYSTFKNLLVDYVGLEKDAVHIHVALLLYILALWLFRQSRRSRFPWLFVFAIQSANEIHDLIYNWPDGPAWALSESAKDMWNTMLWPTVLLVVGRYTNWFSRIRDRHPHDDGQAENEGGR